MKTFRSRTQSRGSALLAAMIVIVVLSVAAAAILSYSMSTYRNSLRQAMLDQGRELSDLEMENLYYNWKTLLLEKKAVANISSLLATNGLTTSSTPLPVSLQATNGQPSGWSVTRAITFNAISGTSDGGATGIVPDTTQLGRNYYFDAKTSASITLPLMGTVSYHSGRHFVYSNTSLFQYAVFYQGNLEMAAGGNMTISGPVSTNASAYLGAQANGGNPFTLTLTDKVYYFQDYNGSSDPLTGETDLLQGTSTLVDPVYNPNPQAAAPTDQASQRALQVNKLSAQSSFIGGVDVQADVNNPAYAGAYNSDPNEIYRAVIAPPPTSGGNLVTEDPTVAGSRMYNNAGIVITIEQTAAGSPNAASGGNVAIHVGISPSASDPPDNSNLNLYDNVPQFSSIVHGGNTGNVISEVRQPAMDPREYLNGATGGVAMTTLDIGALNTALQAANTTGTTLNTNYNGVVYIYDKTDPTTAASSQSLNAIRLINGSTTPAFNDQNNNPLGFTVVSNNGVYVQGDYNATPITVAGTSVTNPAAVMGDAVTALSYQWNRSANTTLQPYVPGDPAGTGREAGATPAIPASGSNPAWGGTAGGMLINAAILTGNTPSTTSSNSGGAQNLVRMIEDWYYPDPLGNGTGMTLTLNGSLGQLFTSKYFSGNYASGVQVGLGAAQRVYIQPKNRVLNYDTNFKDRSPAGSPSTTAFTRGTFYYW